MWFFWFWRLPLRHLLTQPARSLLNLLAIALGTAVYLSVTLAADTAWRSFQAGVTAVAGKAQLRVQSPGSPLPETLFPELLRQEIVAAAAPVVETLVEIRGRETFPALLLGIDPFLEFPFREFRFDNSLAADPDSFRRFLTEPGWVFLSAPLAARLQLRAGETFTAAVGAVVQTFKVAGTFRTPGDLYPLGGALMLQDIGQAQELLERQGFLDYIDLIVRGEVTAAATHLRATLPPGTDVVSPNAAADYLAGLVAAYRLNLSVLSAIALFVGMFLIYQSVTLSVVRRRREIGLLRALGTSRLQILLLFLGEGLVSGLVGGLAGLGLGVVLAQATVGLVAQNLSSLYQPVVAEAVQPRGLLLLQAWLLAVAATLAASWVPAAEAARTKIRAVWYQEELEAKLQSWSRRSLALGLAILGLAALGAVVRLKGTPWPALAAAFLLLVGFALLTPWAARQLGLAGGPVGQRFLGAAGFLGCRYLAGSLSRSAVSIAALASALALVIAIITMISSFRRTVEDWVNRSISGDLFFGPAVFATASYDQFLPLEVLAELSQDPRIADIYLYRCVRLPFRDRYILVIAGTLEVLERHGGLWFRQGQSQEPLRRARLQGEVLVTEPFAEIFGLREGESFVLPTPAGPQTFKIAGIFYDYRTDGAAVWLDLALFRRFWPDRQVNAVRLYLRQKAEIPALKQELEARYAGRYRLSALSHQDLKAGILRIFDETFALTYALEGVAVLVAVFGIITTFLVLVLERERELALLQALGASRSQIMATVLVESGLASLLSYLLGALAGSLLALLLILVINKQAFGWTIHLYFLPEIYWQALLAVVSLGLGAGAIPAWQAVQPHLAALLKEE